MKSIQCIQSDVAIVGAGIIGLAHAYIAAKSGRRVVVFERSPFAQGASVRNFGMIRPIGLPAGPLRALALRSREIWSELLMEAGLGATSIGSLHAAYREDEAEVAKEFSRKAPQLGYDCQWISADETLHKSKALRPEGLLGSLYSPTEMAIDSRLVLRALPEFLNKKYGVEFHFNAPVAEIQDSCLRTPEIQCAARTIVVAAGHDFETLFPALYRMEGLTRCKLQMMRTVPQPNHWKLGPTIAFGLSFHHYESFAICDSLAALRTRLKSENEALLKWGIHVMVSQSGDGELILGDSHEYSREVSVFDRAEINRLIHDYARSYLRVPTLEIAEQWHGVYAKHPTMTYLRQNPLPGVYTLTVTAGIGMTLSFALAEETFQQIGDY
jgi:FAD dependent oxidoreductase TIGR03364